MANDSPAEVVSEAIDELHKNSDNPEVRAVLNNIDPEHLVDRLEGRGGGLRSSKPDTADDNGLIQYVWRKARFHSGADTCIPVTASWWLSDWCESAGIDASVSGITDENGKAINSALDDLAIVVVLAFGGNPAKGAARWKGLLY